MKTRIEVDRHFILEVRIRFSLQAVLEALEFFKTRPDLLDRNHRPNHAKSGWKCARKKLIRIKPRIPIIIYTGYGQTIDQERAKQIGIKSFVMKPILMNEIAAAIRRVLD